MQEAIRYSLCPACDECPEVGLTEDGAVIGEDENVARLSPAEWNVLVQAVRDGVLGPIPVGPEDAGCQCGCGCET